jgi:hydrogenase expression/formation protein HypE
MRELIRSVFLHGTANDEVLALGDGAAIPFRGQWLVLTTDAHVVQPIFFPGGDIGRLSVCGVVNDLAMMGATEVLGLTSAVVLEEGFEISLLEQIQGSIRTACEEAQTQVMTGDTKVMRRGEVDGIVLSTSGLGVARRVIRDSGMQVGDALIATGNLGDHGLAVLSARHQLQLQGELLSDVAPLNSLVHAAVSAVGESLHAMKDPTRGGVVGALTEMATKAKVRVRLDAEAIPLSRATRAAAEILGIDPLFVANEGKAVMAVDPSAVDKLLAVLRCDALGKNATCIGRVEAASNGECGALLLDTGFGTRRLYEQDNDPLPRIC